ncbi:sterol desaturase family protein [Hahella ganghwensis]|uniref:sterol desaturase family protein n=1 Tax=Hahella ganghwensis TaxID=286420 RepID=UPI00035E1193|nr:sterol desaturase family protein [Hahella ganghwensis]
MLGYLCIFQVAFFVFFVVLERIKGIRKIDRADGYAKIWMLVNTFALVWANLWVTLYLDLLNPVQFNWQDGIVFYLVYSFTNYWVHRVKHSNRWFWKYIHRFHHSPSHMETSVAFYKHPIEYAANTFVIVSLAVMMDASIDTIVMALVIEGCLECYHHSNIRTPDRVRWIGYIIQTPEMHLVHHEYGRHRYNYVAFLWDTVFGTVNLGYDWNGRLGFADSHNSERYLMLR